MDDVGSYLICNWDFTAKTIDDDLPVTNKTYNKYCGRFYNKNGTI